MVLWEKFIGLNAFIRGESTNQLPMFSPKKLEKEEQPKPKSSRIMELISFRVDKWNRDYKK